MSVSAWVHIGNMPSAYASVINWSETSGNQYAWALQIISDGAVQISHIPNGGTAVGERTGTGKITANTAHHIFATSTSAGSFKIYIDGALDVSGTFSNLGIDDDTHIWIGTRDGSVGLLNGTVNEVAIFNSDNNASYQTYFNDGIPYDMTSESGLQGYWRNNGLAVWEDLKGSNDITPTSVTETLLIPAGVDGSRDNQGFLMNRQKDTNALNLPYSNVADGYVDLGSTTTYAAGTAFSITLWCKPYHITDNKFIGAGADYISFKDTDEIRLSANSATDDFTINSPSNWTVDEWVHIGIIRNTSNLVTIYINGTAQSDTETVDEAFDYRYIGGLDATDTLDGAVDDVLIYSDELSAAEVTRNYNAGKRSHR